MKPTTGAPRSRRNTTPADPREQIAEALDILAVALKVTGNRKLLPLYERLERELEAREDDEAVMRRALKRAKRQRAPQ